MTNLSFNLLIESINQVHSSFQSQSVKAVNMGLTMRNWCIGFYIVEFEQNGEDRAKYGATLIVNIAQSIKIKGLTAPELSRCRQFYQVYPEILGTKTQESLRNMTNGKTTKQILGSTTQELQSNENPLISFISYTHFVELIKIDNPVLAQLPSIEAIVQQAVGQLPTSIETIVQQAVAQLPNIEDIRHSSRSLKIYSQVHSSFKQILGLSTQELIHNLIANKNLARRLNT
jgi:hypothetical protein